MGPVAVRCPPVVPGEVVTHLVLARLLPSQLRPVAVRGRARAAVAVLGVAAGIPVVARHGCPWIRGYDVLPEPGLANDDLRVVVRRTARVPRPTQKDAVPLGVRDQPTPIDQEAV